MCKSISIFFLKIWFDKIAKVSCKCWPDWFLLSKHKFQSICLNFHFKYNFKWICWIFPVKMQMQIHGVYILQDFHPGFLNLKKTKNNFFCKKNLLLCCSFWNILSNNTTNHFDFLAGLAKNNTFITNFRCQPEKGVAELR